MFVAVDVARGHPCARDVLEEPDVSIDVSIEIEHAAVLSNRKPGASDPAVPAAGYGAGVVKKALTQVLARQSRRVFQVNSQEDSDTMTKQHCFSFVIAATTALTVAAQTNDTVVAGNFPASLRAASEADHANGGPAPRQLYAFDELTQGVIAVLYCNGYDGQVRVLRRAATTAQVADETTLPMDGSSAQRLPISWRSIHRTRSRRVHRSRQRWENRGHRQEI